LAAFRIAVALLGVAAPVIESLTPEPPTSGNGNFSHRDGNGRLALPVPGPPAFGSQMWLNSHGSSSLSIGETTEVAVRKRGQASTGVNQRVAARSSS
jgi:hypothetical protein